jgi:hypothetical protein
MAKIEPKVEPHCILNDFSRKMLLFVHC